MGLIPDHYADHLADLASAFHRNGGQKFLGTSAARNRRGQQIRPANLRNKTTKMEQEFALKKMMPAAVMVSTAVSPDQFLSTYRS